MRRAAFVAAILAAWPPAARADDVVDYVVQEGDTCLGIAIRVLGDRAAYEEIHRLNPELGPTPHDLVVGSVLKLPATGGPDARLTRARGDIKVRRPDDDAWDAASRGMDLFRRWRVGSADDASAELTFRDEAALRMRERTIVILYGPEQRTARVITSAELVEGTLEGRLGELDGGKVDVTTPSAEAELGEGRSLVSVQPDGTSIVANHQGGDVEVRAKPKKNKKNKKNKRKAVKIPVGMGSKVKPGHDPEPPRPLPPTPTWITASGTRHAVGAAPSLLVEWSPVPEAARYRVELEQDGEPIAAREVTGVTSFELAGLPAGEYRVTVAAIDAEGFESVRSPELVQRLVEDPPPRDVPPPRDRPRIDAPQAPSTSAHKPPRAGGDAELGLATGVWGGWGEADPALAAILRLGLYPTARLGVELEAGVADGPAYRASLAVTERIGRIRGHALAGVAAVAGEAGADLTYAASVGIAVSVRLFATVSGRLDLREAIDLDGEVQRGEVTLGVAFGL